MLALVASLLLGCATDCNDTSRITGEYAMWHMVLNAGEGGGAVKDEGYPTYEMFINGWSRWDLTWQSSGGTMNVEITDVAERQGTVDDEAATPQTFSGKLSSGDANCNIFEMSTNGDFVAASGTIHTFTYTSEVVFYGDHFAGSFAYDDSYTGTDAQGTPTAGGLTSARGDVYGVMQTDAFDTGFGE